MYFISQTNASIGITIYNRTQTSNKNCCQKEYQVANQPRHRIIIEMFFKISATHAKMFEDMKFCNTLFNCVKRIIIMTYFRDYSLDYMNPYICHEALNKQLMVTSNENWIYLIWYRGLKTHWFSKNDYQKHVSTSSLTKRYRKIRLIFLIN